ncbi:Gfo/Idh/MocA family protein [Pedobacter cryoconitis]|uniref:Putative dehydrogenase n=1 Tax=Pedobacter cryoconitis TaxID=188932 RepID=A0A327SVV7_9SPHI|nr:Gfo/Idh/MocA family oxidoreductase [Pedobacter cryoconitis]RAJ33470.1 putative dehydrogenase [Pedobacter cryoconitis]
MYKVLVIGCGNIGSQYDMYNSEIQTHVKAWSLKSEVDLFVYDLNAQLAVQVASQYQCEIVPIIDISTLAKFDFVSICTPTNTHFELIEKAIAANVKIIICEKPISNDLIDLEQIKKIYSKGQSKIIVNYIRRFLPAYGELKELIQSIIINESVTNVSVRYQRGFVNNCSHAFDILEYLFDSSINLTDIQVHNKVFDHFKDDATLSLQANWNDINFNILGLSNISFAHFEVDVYSKHYKISIKNSGNVIEVFNSQEKGNVLQPLIIQSDLRKENCLKDYMKFVTDYAMHLINRVASGDNFLNSVELNQKMLNYKNN